VNETKRKNQLWIEREVEMTARRLIVRTNEVMIPHIATAITLEVGYGIKASQRKRISNERER